jgi:hypothetical protein
VLRNLQSNPVLLWQGFHFKILGGFKGVAWSGEGFLQSYLDCKNKLQVMGSLPDCYPSFIFSFSKRIDFIPYNHASKLLGFPASAISCLCASVLPYVLPPCFRTSLLPCFRAAVLPCCRAAVLPCFRASVLPCYPASLLFRASVPGHSFHD